MPLVFEILFPLLWLGLGWVLWRQDRWQATLFAAFYLFCLACEAVAMQFGEYYYDHGFLVEICLGPPRWGEPASCVHAGGCLPLAVPCMEGLFFFAGWIWAARREANGWLRPLFGAVLAVIADLAFDPVAAKSFEAGTWRQWPGIGLWYWILDSGDPGNYFGIPVDNALAWLATCCGFGYAAVLAAALAEEGSAPAWASAAGPHLAALVSLAGLVAAGFFFALLDSAGDPAREPAQAYRLATLFAGAWAASSSGRAWRAWRQRCRRRKAGIAGPTPRPPSPWRRRSPTSWRGSAAGRRRSRAVAAPAAGRRRRWRPIGPPAAALRASRP